jgi:hypothetical protein
MPTHTPSPHRFLAPHPPSTQKSKKPHSGLRNTVAVQTPASTKRAEPKAELEFKKLTPAKRFVLAPPRQIHEVAKERPNEAQEDAFTHSTPRPKLRRKFERVESIEEPSQSSQSEAQGEMHGEEVVQSIEGEGTLWDRSREQAEDQEDEMLFESLQQNKRRRVSPPSSPTLQEPSEPSTPVPASNTTTHRFRVPPPRTPVPFPSIAAVATSTPATAPQRPHFILPALPTSPPKLSRPLPEIFSPSRKNGKYIHGGLASTVTSWIIETANTGFAAQDRVGVVWRREREDGVKLRIRVSGISRGGDQGHNEDEAECYAGGVVFVRGDTEPGTYDNSRAEGVGSDNSPTRVLLAGQGGARGSEGVLVKTGSIIGIRTPMWDIDVGEDKWTVAVDWVLL